MVEVHEVHVYESWEFGVKQHGTVGFYWLSGLSSGTQRLRMKIEPREVCLRILAFSENPVPEKTVPGLAEAPGFSVLDVVEVYPEPRHQFLAQWEAGRFRGTGT